MEQQISHFKILEEIGSGGMGVVYLANDLRLRRKVALKVLPAGALAEPTIRERLVREAQTASTLNHPHIVTVFEIHSAGDRDFIAMEFVEGKSLDRLIADDGMPLEQALRYAVQIADGLSCAHEHGVIHRDLKPHNVMITPADDVKILDFGLAKRFLPPGVSADSSSIRPALVTLTAPGVKVGTPAYMSPEQIESRPVDARSDVFSFGCLLYEMLTGVSPFNRRNAILIFKAVLSEHPRPLRELKPKLPVELGGILTRALEKDPDDRFASMREMLGAIEKVQVERFGTGAFRTRSGVVPVPPPPPRSDLWRPAAAAAVALAVVGLVWWLLGRPPSPPELIGHRLLASSENAHRHADFSPVGDRIAFVSGEPDGVSRIWTRSLDGNAATRVSTVAAEAPRFSVDGERLVFAALGGGLWSVAAGGGPPVRILDVGSRPSLAPDGERLALELDGLLWLAGVDGSGLQPLASVPPAFFARWAPRSPAFSPDGRRIAYFAPEGGAAGGLWVVSASGGVPERLFPQSFTGGDPTWTADGRWIVFSGDLAGSADLWAAPARGGTPRLLAGGGDRYLDPALSRDGRRIVYTKTHPSFELRIDGTGSGERLLERRHEIVRPTPSPSGDRVAYSAPAGPDVHVFTVDTGGADARQVTGGGGERNVLPRWSADGTHLYFYQLRPSRSLRRVPAAGGESTEVLADWSPDRYYDTAVDPTARRVVYAPLDGGKLGKLRVRELENGDERELQMALLGPRWSRDGGLVLGYAVDDEIYLCPVSSAPCRYLADGFEPRWSSDGASITFARLDSPATGDAPIQVSIWTLHLADSATRRVAEIEAENRLAFGYGVLPDGRVVWNRRLTGREELWLAEVE